MIGAGLLDKLPARDRLLALVYYIAVGLGLVATTGFALASLVGHQAAYSETALRLDRIEGRRASGMEGKDGTGPAMTGSPFLEGGSLTIAGAALQKRISTAVEEAGGNVSSSQIDLQQAEGSTDWVSLTANCEIDQAALQKLLYDIEAGMPFLFIDRLLVQPVQQSGQSAAAQPSRLRVQVSVSGQWQQAKR